MKEPFRMLSKEYIGTWIRGLIRKGAAVRRDGLTVHSLAEYTGIPRESLKAYALRGNLRMSLDRQRYLSSLIAKIENGYIAFEGHGKDRARVVDKPQPIRRYTVTFGQAGVRIAPSSRPPPPLDFPEPIGLTASKR